MYTSYDATNELATGGVFSINLETLERTALSTNLNISNPQDERFLVNPNTLTRFSSDGFVYFSDFSRGVFKLDPVSGEREIAFNGNVASGDNFITMPDYLALSPDGKRLLAQSSDNIFEIDLNNGERRAIVATGTDSDVPTEHLRKLTVDWLSNVAYTFDLSKSGSPSLVKFNLDTGVKTRVSRDNSIENPSDLVFDNVKQLIYLVDTDIANTDSLQRFMYSLDPSTGNKIKLLTDHLDKQPTLLHMPWNSDTVFVRGFINNLSAYYSIDVNSNSVQTIESLGLGPTPNGFFADTENQRLLVSNRRRVSEPQAVVAEIPLDGTQENILSDSTKGSGLPILASNSLVYDPDSHRVFITDIAYGGVMMVSLITGDRMLISQ